MDKKEYIEREALIRKIIERREEHSRGEEPPEVELIRRIDHNDFIFMTAHQPAADVAEVVRCKDCRHWVHEEDVDFVCARFCHEYRLSTDFCSYGERNEK